MPPKEEWPSSSTDVPENYVFENPERIRQIHNRFMEMEKRNQLQQHEKEGNAENNKQEQKQQTQPQLLDGKKSDNDDRISTMLPPLQEEELSPSQLQRQVDMRLFSPLACRPASEDTILLAHSQDHYDKLRQTINLSNEELENMSKEDDDIYYCHSTFLAATLACGGVVECVNAVTKTIIPKISTFTVGMATEPESRKEQPHESNGELPISTRAIAIVRPPGHHACQGHAMGMYAVQGQGQP